MFKNSMFKTAALGLAALSLPFMAGCAAQATRPAVSSAPAKVMTLDDRYLAVAKQRVAASDAALKPAYDALIASANKALAAPLETVTAKDMTPLSGDKRDYMSMGPYWWPNPNTPNKLPYVRRDGQTNPEVRGNGLDSARMQRMNTNVRDLALAYYFTGDKKYADRVAAQLRMWFIDPKTRMNPSLRFAQAIPGVVDGRGIGLIDTRNMWMVIDGAALIAPSGSFSAAELQSLRGWFAEFADWMVNSETGHEEDVWHNNHGMFYDAQLVNYLLFVGDVDGAARRTFDAQMRRIASQIAKDGRQHMELERTRPFHYSAFNLEAALRIARYGEQVSVPGMSLKADDPRCVHPQYRCAIDVWNFEIDERSLKRGIDFLANATANPSSWTLATKEEPKLNFEPVVPVLLMAERAYKTGGYAKIAAGLPAETKASLDNLLWPVIK